MNLSVFKQPKGFIKIPEIIFSICAFAILASYSSSIEFNVYCNTTAASSFSDDLLDGMGVGENISYVIVISYPFKLDDASPTNKNCEGKKTKVYLEDDSSSMSIFFVFVGVTSFLFALAMIPVYLFEEEFFGSIAFFPSLDFIAHGIFLIFWFCASISWAAGVANLKVSTDPGNICASNKDGFNCTCDKIDDSSDQFCEVTGSLNFAGPAVADVFGFVNLMLYAGNIWFVYKDTTFHSS